MKPPYPLLGIAPDNITKLECKEGFLDDIADRSHQPPPLPAVPCRKSACRLGRARGLRAMEAPSKLPGSDDLGAAGQAELIKSPEDAINVFDFEPVSRTSRRARRLHGLGIDAEMTLRANRDAFDKYYLRPRRLDTCRSSIRRRDLRREVRRTDLRLPDRRQQGVPSRGRGRGGPRRRRAATCRSLDAASSSVEDAIAARGGPVWFQLYATAELGLAQALVAKAERAGCPLVVSPWTASPAATRSVLHGCSAMTSATAWAAITPGIAERAKKPPNTPASMSTGLTHTAISSNMGWDFVKRLRDTTKMKIMLKGILTGEDAELAVKNGIDGILVSNHGGRGEDSGRATIDVLPEIIAAVNGRMHSDRRQWIPPRHRRGQGARHGCASGRRRAALSLGPWRLRPGGRRARTRSVAH